MNRKICVIGVVLQVKPIEVAQDVFNFLIHHLQDFQISDV